MNFFSKIWLKSVFLFDPIQYLFNGNFWQVFTKEFGKSANKSVLDLACGTGELRKYISPSKYVGLDINSTYISYAKKRFPYPNTSFYRTDITKLKVDGNFDVAISISAAHHLSDRQMENLLTRLAESNIKKIIVVDGFPYGILSKPLIWLDGLLGGGKYFRSQDEISALISKYCKIKKGGVLNAKFSFYRYPYVVAVPQKLHKKKGAFVQ